MGLALVSGVVVLLLFLTGVGFAVYGAYSLYRKRRNGGLPTETGKLSASGRETFSRAAKAQAPGGDAKFSADGESELPGGQADFSAGAAEFPGNEAEPAATAADGDALYAGGPAATPESDPRQDAPGLDRAPARAADVPYARSAAPRGNAAGPSRFSALRRGDSPSLLLRCLTIAGITLALLIPLAFVSDLVDERSDLQRGAVRNIAQLWGRSQTVSGPALIVPYEVWRMVSEKITDDDGKTRTVTRRVQQMEHKVVLPADLSFDAVLEPQTRHYGIYEYVVYTCPIAVRGKFRLPGAEVFDDQLVRILWDKAWFALGVTDLKAINKVGTLEWNGAPAAPFNPGTQAGNLLGPGFHAPVRLTPDMKEAGFALDLNLNGSGGLHFTPVGETTSITARGQWPSPSFGGSLLPAERTLTDHDFSARWSIPHLSRTYPQVGDLGDKSFKTSSESYGGGETGDLSRFTAGVDLYEAVSLYRQVDRAVKYGLLFIGLTFVALLSFELVTRAVLHLMQYGLVGIAMTLFYLVLLSLAEHTAFLTAFLAASGVSIAMNGLYITAALRSKAKGLIITALLAGLYAVLYALLRMEDYALLVGTALVVSVVCLLMFLTRHLPQR